MRARVHELTTDLWLVCDVLLTHQDIHTCLNIHLYMCSFNHNYLFKGLSFILKNACVIMLQVVKVTISCVLF